MDHGDETIQPQAVKALRDQGWGAAVRRFFVIHNVAENSRDVNRESVELVVVRP